MTSTRHDTPAWQLPPPGKIRDWSHSPVHRLSGAGTYIVTAATYRKAMLFAGPERLNYLTNKLLELADTLGWRLHAWSVFPNHYHFIADSPHPDRLRKLVRHLHSVTAIQVNKMDGAPGRKVWFNYWDTHLTFQRSFLARLSYVHQNPVRHGLARRASEYSWCSAGWFERKADRAFYRTVIEFPHDQLDIPDDFDVRVALPVK